MCPVCHRRISIHSPLTRGDRSRRTSSSSIAIFQSTPLSRGETILCDLFRRSINISIHSPLTRGDNSAPSLQLDIEYFNPLPSHEGRRSGARPYPEAFPNFNPLPSHEGRQPIIIGLRFRSYFNPLPSHEGRQRNGPNIDCRRCISIHSPLTRGDAAPAC